MLADNQRNITYASRPDPHARGPVDYLARSRAATCRQRLLSTMDLGRHTTNSTAPDWMCHCASELRRLWPALQPADAMDIARELWTQDGDMLKPEEAAREEIDTYRRLTR